MNDLMVFSNDEFGEVRTVLNEDGSISVNAEDVARGFGWVQTAKSGNKVVRWERINRFIKEIDPSSPQVGTKDYIPESMFYFLGMRAKNEIALKFQKWVAMDVIPSIRKTGEYKQEKNYDEHEKAKIEIDLVDAVSSVLKLNDISKVQLMKNVLVNHNLPTYILPEYTESKGVMKSASQLLKENKIEMSAIKFNQLMKEKGFMKDSFRDSSSGKQKKFNTLLNDTYGQNQVNINNPKETQPMYYEDKFLELFKLITE